ncbi:universal stress protein [Natrarchaeobius halalkaliphilus]|uniref:Universal stress protein n=1 Tax=Natrarchaeobius halalkaliphilus TaxID=1679091 RepID=A0A3N6LZY1_9EURY|nr:universal stress protein [Natrarchaeobius halalkaliphilus]RQG87804.1 universal stress protein [Natrarchaeobius halalkaliphilus]
MNRGLVVVDDSETHRTLLEEAGALAAGSGGELVIFTHLSSDEVESNRETIEAISEQEGTTYDSDVALQPSEQFATSLAEETLSDFGIEYGVETRIVEGSELADEIISTAYETDCDHVFLVGQNRSPTGKAIFGDVVQNVILNFDGLVTVNIDEST